MSDLLLLYFNFVSYRQQDILGFFFLDIPSSLASPFQAFLSSALQVPLSSSFYISVSLPLLFSLFPDSQIARLLPRLPLGTSIVYHREGSSYIEARRTTAIQISYILSALSQRLQAALVYTRLETVLRLLYIVSYFRKRGLQVEYSMPSRSIETSFLTTTINSKPYTLIRRSSSYIEENIRVYYKVRRIIARLIKANNPSRPTTN